MTAPSIKEALEIVENLIRRDPACFNLSDELLPVRSTLRALATFQPDGERREAIARILADPKHQERARYVQGFLYGDDHVIRDVALRENQELFRTKDEHEYEQRLEIEKSKFAAGAILASGLMQDEAGWRDISTAPKDGAEVLLNSKTVPYVGRWRRGHFSEPQEHEVGWRASCCGRWTSPTHWKPLPAPPIRSARDGGEA